MNIPSSSSERAHAAYDQSYTNYQAERSILRRWVRRYYLRAAARLSRGAALDFGCGIGELLQRLPHGSMGVEYNMATVEHCQHQGLNVIWYDGFADDFALTNVPWQGRTTTLILSHVLEHFDDPMHILKRLTLATEQGMERIVVIVPGRAGFKADRTHRTFVDLDLLRNTVDGLNDWSITSSRYFPVNHEKFGDYFVHNELQVVIDRRHTSCQESREDTQPVSAGKIY